MRAKLYAFLLVLFFFNTVAANANKDLLVCSEYLSYLQLQEQKIPDNLYQACLDSGIQFDTDQFGWFSDIPLPESLEKIHLKQIQHFLADYNVSEPSSALDFNGLEQLLTTILIVEEKEKLGLWDQFLRWLKSNLSGLEKQDVKWVDDLIHFLSQLQIPDWLITTLFRGTIVLILILALYTVINELKLSGFFKSRRKHSSENVKFEQSDIEQTSTLEWGAILKLPIKKQVSALLRYAIQSLIGKKLLPENESLTNRELYECLLSIDKIKGQQFANLYRMAELCLYGQHCPDNTELHDLQTNTLKLAEEFQTP